MPPITLTSHISTFLCTAVGGQGRVLGLSGLRCSMQWPHSGVAHMQPPPHCWCSAGRLLRVPIMAWCSWMGSSTFSLLVMPVAQHQPVLAACCR